jgi:hypothetical protein
MTASPGVFLSHSTDDADFVKQLAVDLSISGARVWYYQAEVQVGESFLDKIESAMAEMDFLAVILSPTSVTSRWVRKELGMALTREIDGRPLKVLPVLYQPCEIPTILRDLAFANFASPSDYDQGRISLLRAIGLLEKSSERRRLRQLAGRFKDAEATAWGLGMGSASPSWTDAPEKQDYLNLMSEYQSAVRAYEFQFAEYYDPLAWLRA